ncbi:MAG: hypothetical protein FWF15_08280, partial [Oscillospiraceae bacterium]|nr:hypothetical protein [Oscillospiraceae bacterium]
MIDIECVAKKLISEQLDRIDRTYTEERKAKIKRRMESFWDGEYPSDRFPYTICDSGCDIEIPEGLSESDAELISQLAAIANRGETYDDDFYPALFPGLRQVTLPSYFGCVEETASGSSRVKPIVGEPSEVYNLPEPGFTPQSAGGEILARMREWLEKTGGRVAFYETDMQGPFSVASQVFGIENFLVACHENPKEVHYLINKCTDIFIGFAREMFSIAGGGLIPMHCMPCLYYPQSKGIAYSEDLLAVVSPETTREYINPYAERIAAEFGGALIHTCG